MNNTEGLEAINKAIDIADEQEKAWLNGENTFLVTVYSVCLNKIRRILDREIIVPTEEIR